MKCIERLDELRNEVNQRAVVKNSYKELCDWIGWEVSTNRDQQFKSIQCWMKVEKAGKYFIISEVYDERTKPDTGKKKGRPKTKKVDPKDYLFKNPVGRPRTRQPKLTIKELEERQGYSLYFRSNSKYLEPAYHIITRDILNNNGIKKYTKNELVDTLMRIDYDIFKRNGKFIRDIKGNSNLVSFEYYLKSCCESIIQLNIIAGLCDRKHIFNLNPAYYHYKYDDTGKAIVDYASDEMNKMIQSIIDNRLKENEISNFSELFFPSLDNKAKMEEIIDQIQIDVKALTGWEYWGRGYKFTINPRIPIEAIEYLKDYDVLSDIRTINHLVCDRLKMTYIKRNLKYNRDMTNKTKDSISIGTRNSTSISDHELFCNTITDILDTYLRV